MYVGKKKYLSPSQQKRIIYSVDKRFYSLSRGGCPQLFFKI